MTKKETDKKTTEKETPDVQPIDQIILDYTGDKYELIPLAASWAKVLRRKEEYRHLTTSEILDIALTDASAGNVTWKQVKAALSALAPLGELANGTGKK